MVLSDLGKRLNQALSDLQRQPVVDDATVDTLLKHVCNALLSSDVNVQLVQSLRQNVKAEARELLNEKGGTLSDAQRKNQIQRIMFDHLVKLVDPGEGSTTHRLEKGKQNVIMFVGLQGSGKTTSCTKLALWYKKRGYKVGLVCADTFRAGAFDQLKQNAAKASIAFYGSYTETDPVVIAKAGVASYKRNRFDIIIVDTSGRHKQEKDLFTEMVDIGNAVKPTQTIMVLDASIGQAAEAQSRAFKDAAGYGALFVTKLDGHAKGGGAISAVASTRTPIIFIGTGEHIHDIEPFRARPFISKLLGMGDLSGLMDSVEEVQMNTDVQERQKNMMKKIQEGGNFTIRDWREQITNLMKMGPMSKLAGMIPGMNQMMGDGNGDAMAGNKFKSMLYITDSMTPEELDSDGSLFAVPVKTHTKQLTGKEASSKDTPTPKPKPKLRLTARAYRVARGSGTSVREVEEFLLQYRTISKMVKKMGGKQGWLQQMQGGAGRRGGGMPMLPPGMSREQAMKMQNALPPDVKAMLRQPGGREQLMKQMQSGQVPPSLAGMNGLPGMGGASGGMPDMAQMQQMMQNMGGLGGLGNMMRGMMGGSS
ncbi:signal-recognition-particle GTPase [Malassezia yamatoensis]|uniref:signal-recognition-particle GTPase n=1 Tax=Malassezia yamatoensis TaxID=253288 RepID=A0AAJ5YTB3_9BASI|nr:signal-recognition-particle GTPase [Malassezia yamatoensis]